ncbi:Ferritin-1- chloroplastic [Striga hermonthica]|uniref:Ferritin n=1 Tax=Striga hermonthica TaxID=68872 RepID=A0A9N7RTF8_STRHE|nr:Ferritin-1- chloroplastic [Striga hermonthica]
MFMEAISAVSMQSVQAPANLTARSSSFSPNLNSFAGRGLSFGKKRGNLAVVAASNEALASSMTGFLFQPLEEVRRDEFLVPKTGEASLARQRLSDACEAALNEQINVEYNLSYVYHSMYAYFDRDNVALKGLAKFFKEASLEERDHAEKLIEYQNKRGGRVRLHALQAPPSEYDHPERGDALYAMELSLALEKLANEKLLLLHAAADRSNDPQMADFIESEFLAEQVDAIKKISEYVSQLRRVGKGHGVWHFDQMLLEEGVGAAA